MNALQILSAHPWVERLGWTLVHFLWQGVAIAVLYAAAGRMARASSPHARYLLASVALAAMMAAPLVTWEWLAPADVSPYTAWRIPDNPPAANSAAATATGTAATISLPVSVRAAVSGARPAEFLPWVVMVWLAGSLVFWVRLAGGWMVAARMRSMLVRRAPTEWEETLAELGRRMGVSRPVRLLVSALVLAPMVVGWLRPVVLVPVGALAGLPAGQLEALVLHELAHIRRHDYLVNILQSVAEALLFYHPAVWWVSAEIRREREMCCDDLAVAASGDRLTYARALTQLEACRPAHLHAAVAANGGSLAGRIARLLGQPRRTVRAGALSGPGPGVVAVALLLVAAAYGLFGQPGAHPAFQVVSIKRNTSDWNERYQHSMGMGVNASLKLMIQFAYALHDDPRLGHSMPLLASQVAGGPAWIDSEGYDIDAKPPANTDPKQTWLMWQTLLANRFKLALHRETRERPIYVLTAAKDGLKLPAPPKDLGCVAFAPGTKPHPVPGKVDCGYVSGPGTGFAGAASGELGIRGRKVHMADLIRELAFILDRPISDQTGFTGEFDVALNFAPDRALQGFGIGRAIRPLPGSPSDPNLPNIFAALEQQLGLKLTPAKGPVEVLVVDHAERPATN